jgi:hypothetical protein
MDMETVRLLKRLDEAKAHLARILEQYGDALAEYEEAQLPRIHGKEPRPLRWEDIRYRPAPPKHTAWKDSKRRRTAKPWGDRVKPDYKAYNMGKPLKDPESCYDGQDRATIQFVASCIILGGRDIWKHVNRK